MQIWKFIKKNKDKSQINFNGWKPALLISPVLQAKIRIWPRIGMEITARVDRSEETYIIWSIKWRVDK